ncbi:MAG: hypothetical protein KBF88_16320, partial [Polyangiaceae bacterium]|nr:hypothetical protein [Polyangiaceae bacterium]
MRTSRNESLPLFRSTRVFFAAVILACFSQCGKPVPKVPATLTLSSDPKASESLQTVRDLWTLDALSDTDERKDLDRRLREHLAHFPKDESLPIAKIHAAWMLIENSEPGNASTLLRTLSALPPGWVRDFRDVVQAKAERVLKRPKVALTLLEPLEGKIVDEVTQSLFLAELAMSTLETGDEKRAIFRLDAWLRLVATDEREAVLKSIHDAVDRCSTATLTSTLQISKNERKLLLEVERIVIERIAQIAVSTNDHELARWLFSVDARSGESATNAELHQLSTHETYAVQGRTVGLVLPTSTPKLRAVATEVARGLAWSLGLPRKDVDADTLRLVTREDNGLPQSLERAMAELASDGATVIIAGFDADSSDR